MASSAEAFADPSALIASADRVDAWYALLNELFADPPPVVTMRLVVAKVTVASSGVTVEPKPCDFAIDCLGQL